MRTEEKTKQKGKEKGKKTKKDSGGGHFHNYLIYRFLKILLLISRQGSPAGTDFFIIYQSVLL